MAHSLRGLSITVGKAWSQEPEAAGHTKTTVKKEGAVKPGAQLMASFCSAQDPSTRNAVTYNW